MRRVFVDTSAFVALRNPAEREHEAARGALRDLVAERVLLFTSSYVFSETYTALLVRVSRHVDATSFALMAREGVTEAFSLDANFAQRGLRVLPGPA